MAVTFVQATSDLASSVGAELTAGDTALAASQYSAAVSAYQLAGQQGATMIGPEIDSAGQPDATKPFTQPAWQLNASLAAIQAATATQADALTAQAIAYKMRELYGSAIQAGIDAQENASTSASLLPVALAIGGIGLTFGILYALLENRRMGTVRKARPLFGGGIRVRPPSNRGGIRMRPSPSMAVTRRA